MKELLDIEHTMIEPHSQRKHDCETITVGQKVKKAILDKDMMMGVDIRNVTRGITTRNITTTQSAAKTTNTTMLEKRRHKDKKKHEKKHHKSK